MRRVVVTWPNATHDFLAVPRLKVVEVSTELSPVSSFPGDATKPARFEFEIASDSSIVIFDLSFISSITGQSVKIFNANQFLIPGKSDLVADTHFIETASGQQRAVAGRHPLILLGSDPANLFAAVTVIHVNTEFVDVTEIWDSVAAGKMLDAHKKLHEPGVDLAVLGFTGGAPLLWMASIPSACRNPVELSALTFFRPELPFTYTSITDPNHGLKGVYPLNRFLLAPDIRASSVLTAGNGFLLSLDTFAGDLTARNEDKVSFLHVCASFEAALQRSGKPVVLFQPWAQQGIDFGLAQTALLYEGKLGVWGKSDGRLPLVESAMALLRSRNKIARGSGDLKIMRRGLSGFSAGGTAFWAAFSTNKKLVQEVYSFDTKGTDDAGAEIAQWARVTPGFQLHLTGGFRFEANAAVKQAVEQALKAPGAASGTVSVHPSTRDFWLPPAQGGSPWWDMVLSNSPNLRKMNDAVVGHRAPNFNFVKMVNSFWHQFALFGGEVFDPAVAAPRSSQPGPNSQGYMEMFLRNSGF